MVKDRERNSQQTGLPKDTRSEDEKITIAAGEFGKALYMEQGLYADMYYVNDIPTQKAGVDIIMEGPQGLMYIDEKMAIRQRDRNLTTYSLELSSENNKDKNGNSLGWFTAPGSKTTHYAFTWFRADSAISTVTSWQTALVSKESIKNMLQQDGIDVETIKDKFLKHLDSHLKGQQLPDGIAIGTQYDDKGNVKSYEWKIKGYKVVQSVHLKEQPINLVVPKEKLIQLAAKEKDGFIIDKHDSDRGCYNVQQEIQRIRNRPRVSFPSLTINKIDQIRKGNEVPRELSFASAKYARKTSKLRSAQDGDFLYIGDKPREARARVATYSKSLHKWLVAHPDFPIKNDPNFIDIKEYIRNELMGNRIPALFKTADILHNPVDPTRFQNPQHGDIVYMSGAATGGQRIMLTYNKYIDSYSLSPNTIINVTDLPKFMGKPVVDDKILQLERAVGERIIHGLRKTMHESGLTYKTATADEIKKFLPQVLTAVQSSSWKSNRYSDVEAAMQATTPKERSDLFKILNNPRLVPDLAQGIASMSRDDKYLPESISAVIYKPSRQREYERLDLEESLKRTTAQASKTTPIRLEKLAMEKVSGVQTFAYRPKIGNPITCVSWQPTTIEKTAEAIKTQLKPNEPLVIEGKTPMWAATAVAAQMDRPVYMKNKLYCIPVQKIPSVRTNWYVERDLHTTRVTSQGIDFKIQKGVDAVAIDVSPSLTDKQYYFSEINMQRLRMPLVENPPENIYIKIHREDKRDVPAAVIASIAKTYMDMGCNVYMYNGHRKAYTCVNRENLHMEPKRETEFANDMYLGNNITQKTPEYGQIQRQQDVSHVNNSFSQNVEKEELALAR